MLLLPLVAVGGFWIWMLFFSTDLFRFHSANARNREGLIILRDRVQVGDSYEEVLKKYWQKDEYDLTLRPIDEKCWLVLMPSEIFATDWRMTIGFEADRVSAIKIRTSDGPRSTGSPDDIGYGSARGH